MLLAAGCARGLVEPPDAGAQPDSKPVADAPPKDLPPDLSPDLKPDLPIDPPPVLDAPPDLAPDLPPDLPPDMPGPVSCTGPADCSGRPCVDGFCCDGPCAGTCEACNLSGTVGLCTAIPDGVDPAGECAGTGTCAGTCSGARACRFPGSSTPCGSTSCGGGAVTGTLCDGKGGCVPGSLAACAPYACAGGACRSSCTGDGDCAPAAYCDGGACKARKPAGTACTAPGECGSGFCRDGVCCLAGCAGICQSCNLPGSAGTCLPVEGADDPDGCTAITTCDGAGACKKAAGQGCAAAADCASGFCADGFCCAAACGACRRCNVTPGTCTPIAAGTDPDGDCGAYTCDGAGSCFAGCGGACSASCKPSFACVGGACLTAKPAGAICAGGCDCASGSCAEGLCCKTDCAGPCRSCAMPTAGTCTIAPAGTDPRSDCAGGLTCDGAGACRTSCAGDGQCKPGLYCTAPSGGACMPVGAKGAACGPDGLDPSGGHACATSICADGRCCTDACAGACRSCSVGGSEGTCTPNAADTDPEGECAGGLTCDGAGVCRSACAGDEECKPGLYCTDTSGGACLARLADGAACGADPVDPTGGHQCASGICSAGLCGPATCAKDADCPIGATCQGATSKCVACTSTTDDDGDSKVAARCGGDDCDDHDAATHPGAPDPADVTVTGPDTLDADASPPWGIYDTELAMAADGTGHVAVAWHNAYDLKYARRGDGGWSPVETPDGTLNTTGSPALVFDAGGTARLLYRYAYAPSCRSRPAGGAWSARTDIDTEGGVATRLVIDGAGTLHAVDYYPAGFTLRYYRKAAAWSTPMDVDTSVTVDQGYPSLAADAGGLVHVTYVDAGPPRLVHATRSATGIWSFETIDADPTAAVGGYSSLAVDGAGKLHVSYLLAQASPERHEIRYATNASGGWAISTLDASAGASGGFTSLALDARGAHVAYFRGGASPGLVYATDLSGAWSTTAVDTSAGGGTLQPVIAVTPDAAVHIAYYATAARDVLHSTLTVTNLEDENCDGK